AGQRAAALRVRLANVGVPAALVAAVALVAASAPRALAMLARGRARAAGTELVLPWAVLGHPRVLLRMRRRAARTRCVSQHALRGLFPSSLPGGRLRERAPTAISIPVQRQPVPPAVGTPLVDAAARPQPGWLTGLLV